MDVNVLSTLISNVGFPIACVCAMFYMQNKEREEHKAETAAFTEAIQNNTLAITRMCDKLDGLEKEVNND